jgi:hypothetical protein
MPARLYESISEPVPLRLRRRFGELIDAVNFRRIGDSHEPCQIQKPGPTFVLADKSAALWTQLVSVDVNDLTPRYFDR